MARAHAYRPRDRHRFRLCGSEIQIADADREADHRRSLVGTALLRPYERTAHTGVRRWLSGPPKEGIGCVALSIPANPARRDWNRSSPRSTRSGKPARLLSHRNGMRDGLSLGIATTTAASRAARWSGPPFSGF